MAWDIDSTPPPPRNQKLKLITGSTRFYLTLNALLVGRVLPVVASLPRGLLFTELGIAGVPRPKAFPHDFLLTVWIGVWHDWYQSKP